MSADMIFHGGKVYCDTEPLWAEYETFYRVYTSRIAQSKWYKEWSYRLTNNIKKKPRKLNRLYKQWQKLEKELDRCLII